MSKPMSLYIPELEAAPLGKQSAYIAYYDPNLLFPVPRKNKRDEINVPHIPPFTGADIWNAYEVSWINAKGKPVVAIAEFEFPCESPNIIESKSFKLYLNSLNNTHFESLQTVQQTLEKDLSEKSRAPVKVSLVLLETFTGNHIQTFSGECIDDLDVEIETYQLAPHQLRPESAIMVSETLYSHLLKSNCLVTGQPDWGSVQISYQGPKIDRIGLLKYIISFRNHNEFHEQCVERIFMDILHHCEPQQLTVYARYTRRGGLDINPLRTTQKNFTMMNFRMARQ